jgi:DNA-binding PucR family transcriptional regulator
VLGLPPAERALLLDTLQAWIDAGGSTRRSAAKLHCHPNTVRYRLQRLQRDLRLSLTDPTSLALLVVALRSWRLFGAARPLPIPDVDRV